MRDVVEKLELEDRKRFQIEIEFVQCLSNPKYLNFLAQRGYFKDEKFLNFLQYLEYWKEPAYAKYLRYPQCLFFLDQLRDEKFRNEIAKPDFAEFVHKQQFELWRSHVPNDFSDEGGANQVSSSSEK
jgi:mediator of RNA polymerase II transcription subunit 31